jgi:hypothetical protein
MTTYGNTMGRPPKFTNPDELEKLGNEYFEITKKNSDYITLTGLALHLGFCDKCSIYDYEKKPDFSHSIKQLRLQVENAYEKSLCKNGRSGDIFALKNFGWIDKTEVDSTNTNRNLNANIDAAELKEEIRKAREAKNGNSDDTKI